jgi:hypothetical protein
MHQSNSMIQLQEWTFVIVCFIIRNIQNLKLQQNAKNHDSHQQRNRTEQPSLLSKTNEAVRNVFSGKQEDPNPIEPVRDIAHQGVDATVDAVDWVLADVVTDASIKGAEATGSAAKGVKDDFALAGRTVSRDLGNLVVGVFKEHEEKVNQKDNKDNSKN